jgi:hypothetical protein
MKSTKGRTGNTTAGATNPYTQAYHCEGGIRGSKGVTEIPSRVLKLPVVCTRFISNGRHGCWIHRAWLHASLEALSCRNALGIGTEAFIVRNTPTMGDLVDYTQHRSSWPGGPARRMNTSLSSVAFA